VCTTIQVAVPARIPEAWDFGRRLLAGGEAEHIGQVDGDEMLLISNHRCECGTPLGSGGAPPEWDEAAKAHDVKRLRKRGWSARKIERWVEAKHANQQKLERLAHEHADGPSAQPVEGWLDFLEEALSSVGRVGLRVCHGDESWSAATPHETFRIGDVTAADLRAMSENTLYVFVA
jgi:hypothetical protein